MNSMQKDTHNLVNSNTSDINTKQKLDSLKPHGSYCFVQFFGESIKNVIANNSLFKNSTMSKCELQFVSFKSSDFDGTVFEKSEFNNCDFSYMDVRSICAQGSLFRNVDFTRARLSDCSFELCVFEHCTFDHAQIDKCDFQECKFLDFDLNHGGATLNTFKNVYFDNALFRNVSYFQNFIDCQFQRTRFEAYLLGYTYGLSPKNIESFDFLFMGAPSELSIADIIEDIREEYFNRKMYVNVGILGFIDTTDDRDKPFLMCLAMLSQMISMNILVQSELVQFLYNIYCQMKVDNLITPKTIYDSIIMLENVLNLKECIALEKARPSLHMLHSALYFDLNRSIDNMKQYQIETSSAAMVMEAKFDEKPEVDLLTLLQKFQGQSIQPEYLDEREECWIGSYLVDPNVCTYLMCIMQLIGLFVQLTATGVNAATFIVDRIEHSPCKSPREENSIEVSEKTVEKAPEIMASQRIIRQPDCNECTQNALGALSQLELSAHNNYGGLRSCTMISFEDIKNEKLHQ